MMAAWRGDIPAIVAAQGGLLAWAAHFTLVYGAQSVLCARGLHGAELWGWPAAPALVIGATLLCAPAAAAVMLRAARRLRRKNSDAFLDGFALSTSLLALVAILYQATPALLLPACG
jgi:hypothetical protein